MGVSVNAAKMSKAGFRKDGFFIVNSGWLANIDNNQNFNKFNKSNKSNKFFASPHFFSSSPKALRSRQCARQSETRGRASVGLCSFAAVGTAHI